MSGARQARQKQAKRRTASKQTRRIQKKQKSLYNENLPVLEKNACGIDVGSKEMYVAVPADRSHPPVRVFPTFTEGLRDLVQWVKKVCKITTVAMESTGIYWIPLYQMLEDAGIQVCLVNARHMKNVPGRRTDWHECQWIQYLHSVGLLRAAFRPKQAICEIRELLRFRGEMVAMSSTHILHMQKAMREMNLNLDGVISDITGVTGLAIIDAIVAGVKEPEILAEFRDSHVKATKETIRKSLEGDYRKELIHILRQSLELFRFVRKQIDETDEEIQKYMRKLESKVDLKAKPYVPPKEKRKNRERKRDRFEKGSFDMGEESYRIWGVDVTAIPGLGGLNCYTLLGEIGADLSSFPSSKHFVSYLALCPDNDISGGKVLWRGSRKLNTRAGQIFRMAASTLHRSHNPIGVYLDRMKGVLGPEGAIFATARKLARIFFSMVKYGREYDEKRLGVNAEQKRRQEVAKVLKQATKLGIPLGIPLTPPEKTAQA